MKHQLPSIYINFYNSCSVSRPKSMIGTDLRNDDDNLNEYAIELIEEQGIENFLEPDDYVFMMHQGYMFWYFKANGDENPDVYYYLEGNTKPEREFKLKEFIEKYPQRRNLE